MLAARPRSTDACARAQPSQPTAAHTQTVASSPAPQALRHQLVPSALPRHSGRLLELLLVRLRRWPRDSGQLELWAEAKGLLFEASVGALFGTTFLGQNAQAGDAGATAAAAAAEASAPCPGGGGGGAVPACSAQAQRLQDAFFAFEAGFELAASPVPHLLQPRFLAARRTLLRALRCAGVVRALGVRRLHAGPAHCCCRGFS